MKDTSLSNRSLLIKSLHTYSKVFHLFVFRYFSFITQCKNPKACTILLRGASKDVLNEVERNLQDALHVARNVMQDPRLVPGGGAAEMAISHVRMVFMLFLVLNL